MNNRQRMRASNKLVREWLLENGYDDIWFKPHGKRNDYVFTQHGSYMAQDIWNLFDGMCTGGRGYGIYYLQMKTNAWPDPKPYLKFIESHPQTNIIVFNVTNKSSKNYRVLTRFYP